MDTILDCMNHWSAVHPDKNFSVFLDRHGKPRETYTYQSFEARTRFLAEYLHSETSLQHGDRVALVYPPGLEMVAAFFACARMGAIPVPVAPVLSVTNGGSRLRSVMLDSGAALALADSSLVPGSSGQGATGGHVDPEDPLAGLGAQWLATDRLQGAPRGDMADNPARTLFLQYTSGSTGDPKGVIVSHQNVIHNCRSMIDHQATGVSWLPQFHDLGLIGYYLFQAVTGGTTYGFSPLDFLRRPVLWLETLSKYKATYTSSPNFGFEYCLSRERVPDDQLEGLDLSSVQVFMNAAEPVRPSTHRAFLERFAEYGLRPAAHVAAYGLAESTLAVSNSGRRSVKLDRGALHARAIVTAGENAPPEQYRELVSCGKPLDGIEVRIVDPDTRAVVGHDGIGEIWIAGQSTCQGYWNRPGLSEQVFGNSIAGDSSGAHSYLRTGDLGFLADGELFVCGRLKDVIILRGQNYYPEDLETAVERSSEKIHAGSVAAFRGADEEERLVVVVGLRNQGDQPQPAEISRSLRVHGYTGPHTIVFVRRQAIKRTTSGKVARSATRDKWLDGGLRTIETHVRDGDEAGLDWMASTLDVQSHYERFLEKYSLGGDEDVRPGEAGLDSLAMAELLVILEGAVSQSGHNDLQEDLHIPLLQRLSVSEISGLVRGFRQDPDDWAANLHTKLDEVKREREESEAAAMRRDARLDALSPGALPVDGTFKQVLLTGATGFLGPYLLRSLLDQTDAVYTVLVRAADPAAARERLRTDLVAAGLYGTRTAEVFDARVMAVCGDLASPRLGLPDHVWLQLAETIDTIVHNGAWVDYILDYESLRPSNVESTRELLNLAQSVSRKQLHFVSSTTIFGWTGKRELLEKDPNAEMAGLDFGYAQTKWVAEQLVLQAREQGIDAIIYRPAFLTASTAGLGHSTDIVVRLLSFMIKYGVAPNADIQLSFMPVDIAAHNIAAVMTSPAGPTAPVLHVTIDEYFNMVDLTTQISKDYDIPFRYVSLQQFSREMKELCTPEDPVFPLVDFVARAHSKVIVMEGKKYRNTEFRQTLKNSGAGIPDASLQETVSFLMTHLQAEGMLPAVELG